MKPSKKFNELTSSFENRKNCLYNIAPIQNVASIMEHGLLSHDNVLNLEHVDISLETVQNRRDNKQVTKEYKLHHYANLLFNYMTPMLSKVRNSNDDICILLFGTTVLDLDGVVVSDRNASCNDAVFYEDVQFGLEQIDFATVFSDSSFANDEYIAHVRAAEILVPDKIPASKIYAALVFNKVEEQKLLDTGFDKLIFLTHKYFW